MARTDPSPEWIKAQAEDLGLDEETVAESVRAANAAVGIDPAVDRLDRATIKELAKQGGRHREIAAAEREGRIDYGRGPKDAAQMATIDYSDRRDFAAEQTAIRHQDALTKATLAKSTANDEAAEAILIRRGNDHHFPDVDAQTWVPPAADVPESMREHVQRWHDLRGKVLEIRGALDDPKGDLGAAEKRDQESWRSAAREGPAVLGALQRDAHWLAEWTKLDAIAATQEPAIQAALHSLQLIANAASGEEGALARADLATSADEAEEAVLAARRAVAAAEQRASKIRGVQAWLEHAPDVWSLRR